MNVERYLCGYSKESEALEFEMPLNVVPIDDLRRILMLPDDNPLFDCYPVTPEIENLLRVGNPLPLLRRDELDYFLECCAAEEKGKDNRISKGPGGPG